MKLPGRGQPGNWLIVCWLCRHRRVRTCFFFLWIFWVLLWLSGLWSTGFICLYWKFDFFCFSSHSFTQIWWDQIRVLWEKHCRYCVPPFFFLKSVLQLFPMQLFPIYAAIVCWNHIESKISAWCWEEKHYSECLQSLGARESAAISLSNLTLGHTHTHTHAPSFPFAVLLNKCSGELIKTTSSPSLIRPAIMAAITALIGAKKTSAVEKFNSCKPNEGM